MTTLEKCALLRQRGYRYDSETGKVFNPNGIEIGSKNKQGYKIITLVKAHQFAFYYVNGYVPKLIDHINQVKDDNRISNLRELNDLKSAWNKRGRKGVYKIEGYERWKAMIQINKKYRYLGTFDTEQEARTEYLRVKQIVTSHIVDDQELNLGQVYERKIKGYSQYGKNGWEVSVTVKGVRNRQRFKTEDEAKEAYKKLKEININN